MNATDTPTATIEGPVISIEAHEAHTKMQKALYDAFAHFNKRFCGDNPLPIPVITIMSAGRKRALGWFWQDRWAGKEDGSFTDEINISAEHAARGAEDILETLLHEMAHQKNRVNIIKDCNASQYHNKEFKREAENFGLRVEKSKRHGWAHTFLTDAGKHAIDTLPFDINVFNIARVNNAKAGGTSPYITVALKKDGWSHIVEDLVDSLGLESPTELVKSLLEHAHEKLVAKNVDVELEEAA